MSELEKDEEWFKFGWLFFFLGIMFFENRNIRIFETMSNALNHNENIYNIITINSL